MAWMPALASSSFDTGLRSRPFRTPVGWSRSMVVGVAAAVAVGVMVVVVMVGWRLAGGSWAIIQTPSMGTADPVGTLVLLRPAELADLAVGDVISYRPADNQQHIYTHRVVAKFLDGNLQVRGDINGAADPLPVAQTDLVGKVVGHLKGVGYLIRALPTLLLGEIVLLLVTGYYIHPRWRSSVRIIGCCLLVGVISLITRPFVHPVLIAVTDQGGTGSPVASVVSTGILPTRITGADGHHIILHAGQTGTIPVEASQAGGPVMINGSPHLHGWWLTAMIIVSLTPMLWCLTIGLKTDQRTTHQQVTGPEADLP